MSNRSKSATRIDNNLNFPLRPSVLCSKCQKPMSAGNCHGGNGTIYAKYWCRNKSCLKYGKTVPASKIHSEFELVLKKISISQEKIKLTEEVMKMVWQKKKNDHLLYQKAVIKKRVDLERRIESLVESVSSTSDEEIKRIYEQKIRAFNKELQETEKELKENIYTEESFRIAIDTVFTMLKNPIIMWKSNEIIKRRTILQMYFDKKLIYDLEEGFRNNDLAYPIKLISELNIQKNSLVEKLLNNWNLITNYIYRWYPILTKLNFTLSK